MSSFLEKETKEAIGYYLGINPEGIMPTDSIKALLAVSHREVSADGLLDAVSRRHCIDFEPHEREKVVTVQHIHDLVYRRDKIS